MVGGSAPALPFLLLLLVALVWLTPVSRAGTAAPALSAVETEPLDYSYYFGTSTAGRSFPTSSSIPTPMVVSQSIVLAEVDNDIISSATVTVTALSAEDSALGTLFLDTANAYGVTSSYDSLTGVLTLTGSGTNTKAEFQDILRHVYYRCVTTYRTSDTPTTLHTKRITFEVTDVDGASNSVARDVELRAVERVCLDVRTCTITYPPEEA